MRFEYLRSESMRSPGLDIVDIRSCLVPYGHSGHVNWWRSSCSSSNASSG